MFGHDCFQVERSLSTGEGGYLASVNYPNQYLNALECHAQLRGRRGGHVALEFLYFDVGERTGISCTRTDYVTVYLDGEYGRRHLKLCGSRVMHGGNSGSIFVGYTEELHLGFHSDANHRGNGFQARYWSSKECGAWEE